MNILFIGAHPDDLEILCGGTISRCVKEGHEVRMAIATNGNVGSPTLSRPRIAELRRQEASSAAERLGVRELIWMDEDDEFLFDDKRVRLKFVDAIRRARADVIVAHNPNDYHPDHIASSKCATDARILSSVRLIETEHAHLEKQPELFYMDSIAGLSFTPQYYVDISETFEDKMAALKCHASQDIWIKDLFNLDLGGLATIQSSFRGLQTGVSYAEAFVQPSYWPKRPITLPFLR